MKTMTIEQSNHLIACFYSNAFEDNVNKCFLDMQIGVNRDWNLIMKVVDYIETLLHDDSCVEISFNRCFIENFKDGITIEGIGNSTKEATYKAICEFIQWYNNQK